MTTLILGNITFFDPQLDGVRKALVHEITGIIKCKSPKRAEEIGESLVNEFDSYLVPAVYNGELWFECDLSIAPDFCEITNPKPLS